MRPSLAALLIAVSFGVAGAGCIANAAGSDAGTVVATPRFVPAAGPVLAGDGGVAWVSRRGDAVLDLWVAEPGRGPRRVQRFSGSDTEHLRRPRLSASATELVLEIAETRASGAGRERALRVRSYRGAFGQPLLPAVEGGAAGGVAVAAAGRAVLVTRGCASAEIRVLSAPAEVGARDRCLLRLRSGPRLWGGRLRLGLSCAGFEIGCSARVTVTARGRVIARGSARYNHSTPPFAAANLRLGPRALRMLRARPRTRVRITARIGSVTRSTTRTIARVR